MFSKSLLLIASVLMSTQAFAASNYTFEIDGNKMPMSSRVVPQFRVTHNLLASSYKEGSIKTGHILKISAEYGSNVYTDNYLIHSAKGTGSEIGTLFAIDTAMALGVNNMLRITLSCTKPLSLQSLGNSQYAIDVDLDNNCHFTSVQIRTWRPSYIVK